jgi:hypothetical protein
MGSTLDIQNGNFRDIHYGHFARKPNMWAWFQCSTSPSGQLPSCKSGRVPWTPLGDTKFVPPLREPWLRHCIVVHSDIFLSVMAEAGQVAYMHILWRMTSLTQLMHLQKANQASCSIKLYKVIIIYLQNCRAYNKQRSKFPLPTS